MIKKQKGEIGKGRRKKLKGGALRGEEKS